MAKCIDFKAPEKTYKTRANMATALNKLSLLAEAEYLTCVTEDGRFYPVFLHSRLPEGLKYNLALLPQLGFCVVN